MYIYTYNYVVSAWEAAGHNKSFATHCPCPSVHLMQHYQYVMTMLHFGSGITTKSWLANAVDMNNSAHCVQLTPIASGTKLERSVLEGTWTHFGS